MNTRQREWKAARAVAIEREAKRTWDDRAQEEGEVQAELVAHPQLLPVRQDSSGVTIERAIATFTAEFEEDAAPNTQKKYRLLLSNLKNFAAIKGM